MAHVQYNQAGIATALHVTAEEWERPRRMATLSGDHAQMFHSMRVYVTPEPRRRRWYDTATEKLRAAGRWIMRRWREWKARIEAPELGPRRATPPPPRPLLYRGMLYSSLHFRSNPAAGVRIVAVCAVIAMLATAARAACPPDDSACELPAIAAAQEPEPMEVDSDAVAAPAPATLADWMRTHLAAVVTCPLRTGDNGNDDSGDNITSCPSAGLAIRVTPDRWAKWAAGPFIEQDAVGPFVARVLFRGEGGSAGIGIGYAFPRDEKGIDLSRGVVKVGIPMSLAGARGGGE